MARTSNLVLAIIIVVIVVSTLLIDSVLADTRRHARDEVTGYVGSTHEELLSSRAEKRDIFHERLSEMKVRMDQHMKGEKLLSETEYYKLEKKINAYEHKVDYLDKNSDLRHLDRLLIREEVMNDMHRARLSRSADEL
jgi:hypothetical protein